MSLEKKAMNATAEEVARHRRQFWNRLRGLGLIREPELIQVYRLAQQHRIAPEEAAVALGVMTERQIRELLGVCGDEGASLWSSPTASCTGVDIGQTA